MNDTRPPRVSRRAAQAVIAAMLAVGASMAFAAPVQAANKVLKSDRDNAGWYWSTNQDVRACTPTSIPPPAPGVCNPTVNTATAAPISPGHLGVSWKLGSSDMRAYIAFDTSFIPLGSTLNSFVIQLTVSRPNDTNPDHASEHAGAKAPATSNEDQAKIKACLVTVSWGAAEGAPPSDRDPQDPTKAIPTEPAQRNGVNEQSCVDGKQGTVWTFDITPIARKWISGEAFNNGVALLPSGGQTDNYTVEFHGAYYANAQEDPTGQGNTIDKVYVSHKEEAVAKISYEPAVPPPPPPGPTITPPVSTGGGGTTTPPVTPSTEPLPSTSPLPSNSPAPLPVAQSKPTTPWYAWLMLPMGVVGFVGLSRAIGREGGEGTTNRVAEVLRRRRTDGTTGD